MKKIIVVLALSFIFGIFSYTETASAYGDSWESATLKSINSDEMQGELAYRGNFS